MRWDEVFADLQAQFRAAQESESLAVVGELAEAEIASTTLADRWRAALGRELTLRLADGTDRQGTVRDVAQSWLVLAHANRRSLIPAHAVVWVRGLGPSAPPATAVERALSLGHVFRAMAAQELEIVLHTSAGAYRGRLARVAADHCDIASTAGIISVGWHAILSVEAP